MTPRMHEDEVPTDEGLVRRLLRAQFPAWADLPIASPLTTGTDHAIFRAGTDLSVRLPRIHWAASQPAKEARWLPRLAPHLPLTVPVPRATGAPGEGYPFAWSVHPWIEGRSVTFDRLASPEGTALRLAAFLRALQAIDAAGGPAPGEAGSLRGAPLAALDASVRRATEQLAARIDTRRVLSSWEAALEAPAFAGAPVWIHGDLSPGNLLERRGEVHAVIDFGCLAVGDPACDLLIAWSLLRGPSRQAFRRALAVDDATWQRGRGWALFCALIALPYYLHTNPGLVALSWHTLEQALGGGPGSWPAPGVP